MNNDSWCARVRVVEFRGNGDRDLNRVIADQQGVGLWFGFGAVAGVACRGEIEQLCADAISFILEIKRVANHGEMLWHRSVQLRKVLVNWFDGSAVKSKHTLLECGTVCIGCEIQFLI